MITKTKDKFKIAEDVTPIGLNKLDPSKYDLRTSWAFGSRNQYKLVQLRRRPKTGAYVVIRRHDGEVLDRNIKDPWAYFDSYPSGVDVFGPRGAVAQYRKRRVKDSKLPADPVEAYAGHWMGWPYFLGVAVATK